MSVGGHVRCDCQVCMCLVLMQRALGWLLLHMEGIARRSTLDAMSAVCASWGLSASCVCTAAGLVKTHPSSSGVETLETYFRWKRAQAAILIYLATLRIWQVFPPFSAGHFHSATKQVPTGSPGKINLNPEGCWAEHGNHYHLYSSVINQLTQKVMGAAQLWPNNVGVW